MSVQKQQQAALGQSSQLPDVSELLSDAQSELTALRERVADAVRAGSAADQAELRDALARVEEQLRARSLQLLERIDNRVRAVPSLEDQLFESQRLQQLDQMQWQQLQQEASNVQQPWISSLSPGEQWKQLQAFKALADPHNPFNRPLMRDRYAVALPRLGGSQASEAPAAAIVRGSNVDKPAPLPRANRIDSSMPPPPITEDDARRGILSLMQRGLIPPASKLTLDPSPIRQRTMLMHDPAERRDQADSDDVVRLARRLCAVKTDANSVKSSQQKEQKQNPQLGSASGPPPPSTPTAMAMVSRSVSASATAVTKFVVQNGHARTEAADFKAFRQRYCLDWGSVASAIRAMEQWLQAYSVPIAFVNGEKLFELAIWYELEGRISNQWELLDCLINREDVQRLVEQPGRRFTGPSGRERASTIIQAVWRGHQKRKEYREYKRKKWAAGIIAIEWILHLRLLNIKGQLKETRSRQLDGYRRRFANLEASWDNWRTERRTIIHMPSLGYPQHIRDNIKGLGRLQNTQMARLGDLRDPNIDVILVSPVPMSDEMLAYYTTLTGIRGAVESGQLEDQRDISDRYRIIVPEAVKNFPQHNMCLSTLLKYSPRALNRIRNLVRGRRAYIVPGFPCSDDLAVADKLDLPILCSEPEVTELYGTKSGAKRVFQAASVPTPPSDFDIYSSGQLQDCLAQLITENLSVRRWLLKMDTEFDGRGIAYLDADRLPCFEWALRERQRFGENWSQKWAQEKVYLKVSEELPALLRAHGRVACPEAYPNWQDFMNEFTSQGGIVEATPPTEGIVACVTVDLCIEPTGNIRIVSCGDQVRSTERPYACLGASLPQCSAMPSVLNDLCERIGTACWERKIFGHLSVDFLVFEDPETEKQTVWATDLSLHYSDSAAMMQLLLFATNGRFNPFDHELTVAMSPAEKAALDKKTKKTGLNIRVKGRQRFAAMSTRLWHSNLAAVHYSVFFQTCKAQGIGYDVTDKTGTLFCLVDSFQRDCLCMLTLSDDVCSSLQLFAKNLSMINQEISTPEMKGRTNFQGLAADLDEAIAVEKTKESSRPQSTKE
uniref:IQ domain-containing protein H n=2 Tax=Macrostomum lignano TaxID=282301 RepID=A0A1I8JM34_9PLAT